MARAIRALVEPEVVKWARTSANLEPLAAARKIGVEQSDVLGWEDGTVRPTIKQLRDAAKVYRRSLAVFFLPEPRNDFGTIRDFRRFDPDQSPLWSTALLAELRRAIDQRDVFLEITDLRGQTLPRTWLAPDETAPDETVAAQVRKHLLRHSDSAPPARAKDDYTHLNFWTALIEESGALVLCTEGGGVSTEEMRAFSLSFTKVPVIVLNGADWPRPRLFSLLHEYAHIVLHEEGVCDTSTDRRPKTDARQIEARCNRIAAAVLMPPDEIVSSPEVQRHERDEPWTLYELLDGSRRFGVSAESYLRRLTTLGLARVVEYDEFKKSTNPIERKGNESGKGNYYNTKVRDLGRSYVRAVTDAHRIHLIDSYRASQYLRSKVEHIPRLAAKVQP